MLFCSRQYCGKADILSFAMGLVSMPSETWRVTWESFEAFLWCTKITDLLSMFSRVNEVIFVSVLSLNSKWPQSDWTTFMTSCCGSLSGS